MESPHPEGSAQPDDLAERLSRDIVGQSAALSRISPYIQTYRAGLAPEGRPAGIFLLLGPTGTGKTRTVEALAEVLHGDRRRLIIIDCGEFQSDHEVAKLIGAPPGYVGHRESVPRLSRQKLLDVTSDRSDLAIVLFDEIEKAAPSLATLLLGLLDRGTLQLGDGSSVNFEKTLIFFTSNLGARDMKNALEPAMGFRTDSPRAAHDVSGELARIGAAAVRKQFSPEFVNRIDVIITYQPLDAQALDAILDLHLDELQRHVATRLGASSFDFHVAPDARAFLSAHGTSAEYGARELKRVIHRYLTQPLAVKVATGGIAAGAEVHVRVASDGESLDIIATEGQATAAATKPRVLVVDDNESLTRWLRRQLEKAGFEVETAGTLAAARQLAARTPDAALIDYLLPDGDGIEFAVELSRRPTEPPVALMTGLELSSEDIAVCRECLIPVILKPFLAGDVVNMLTHRVPMSPLEARAAVE